MQRSGASRAVTVVVSLLVAGLALAVLVAVAAGEPITLGGTPLGWLPAALVSTLTLVAAAAAVAALVRGLRDRSVARIAHFGASAAVAGGGVIAVTGPSSLAMPVVTSAGFLVVAALMRDTRPLRDNRGAVLAAVVALLIAEAAAVAHLLPVAGERVATVGPALLAGAVAAAAAAAALGSTGPASGAAAALAVGAAGLLLDRGESVEWVAGVAAVVAAQLLVLRGALEPSDTRDTDTAAGTDDRLPDLATRLSDAVLRFDGRLELRDWNEAATGLLGLDHASTGTRLEDLLGISLGELPDGDGAVATRRILGGLEVAVHRSGQGVTAIVRDPGATPEAEQLANELRTTIEELLRARRTIDLQRGELQRLATVDALTGVASRGAIIDRLRLEVAQARRYDHPLAVVLLDLDRFREINGAHGLTGGDGVLREVALRIRLRVREADALGRFGSDGFLAVLPHTDEAGAAMFADALKHRLGFRPVAVGDALVPVTVSIGVATMRAGEDLDLDGILARVEEALASAQAAGGDRIALDRLHGLARLDDPHAPRGSTAGDEITG